jgi:hypothetical protein
LGIQIPTGPLLLTFSENSQLPWWLGMRLYNKSYQYIHIHNNKNFEENLKLLARESHFLKLEQPFLTGDILPKTKIEN